jgi:lantibiotic modifying enzyme
MAKHSATSMTTNWQPILPANVADEARSIVVIIADQLRDWAPPAHEDHPPGWSACVASGYAGLALFFAYLALSKLDDAAPERAARFLDKAMERVAEEAMNPSLYSGFTGVAWTIAHLQKHLVAADAEDSNEAVDAALGGFLAQSPWKGDFDLVNGVVGFGAYALERLPHPAAVNLLGRIVDCLEESATKAAPGLTWWTNPLWLPRHLRKNYPKGYFNLGLAHGVPGIIALLGAACAAGVNAHKARAMLVQAVNWLLAQEIRIGDWVGFPPWIEPDVPPGKNRLAWCYGDLGIAIALLGAARSAGERVWEERALAIAHRAARCPMDQASIQDAGLCHGAAGAGHLFHRLYRATGDAALGDASRYWFRQTLAMREPGRGIAGYAAWWNSEDGYTKWVNEPGFLLGAAGIGLALLAAIAPVEPLWDRLLLVALAQAC